MKKQKLQLKDLKVTSFVTDEEQVKGGVTGDCGTPLSVTCGDCDFQSVPLNECSGAVCVGATLVGGILGCYILWD